MANKMLIDASHPEETRVVVVRGQKVEEFDFESASRRQLRGNIYLAKVTRVEPSLQAAFVEYGGNRHGFLAFSEIHPDYYQIPVADRQALLEAEAEAARDEERAEERKRRRGSKPKRARADETVRQDAPAGTDGEVPVPGEFFDAPVPQEFRAADSTELGGQDGLAVEPAPEISTEESQAVALIDAPAEESAAVEPEAEARSEDDRAEPEPAHEYGEVEAHHREASSEAEELSAGIEARSVNEDEQSLDEAEDDSEDDEAEDAENGEEDESDAEDGEEAVEQVGGGDALEDVPERPRQPRRQYKIQEVIKRRQILLVQVVKEERGNKGAALTTYLSLAGRYSVLMPNTGRGGGISRKITNAADRKRLKEIAQELEVPEGMGIILRTAGASRTKPEIKRDFEYLMRLWESVRELTLSSTAPALVYEEGSLVKRAIRDLYNKDIDEVIVSGEEGYREAKDFMRMLMPSQARIVKPYRDPHPLFAHYGVEAQLDAMFSNHVTLKSGGYLVINPTEALVSIDVNSGRATREHNIEDTALKTNLEAAEEIARQLRLRDLAGLIVIDFIDMEEKRNNRAVEKKLTECLKNDRARIQLGRISPFGLLEMSRQRIRTGVLESSTIPCPHCAGTGSIRSTPSVALHILRSVEEMLIRSASHNLVVRTRLEVAFYILNQKRTHLRNLETRFGVTISVTADESLGGTTTFAVDRGEPAIRVETRAPATGVQIDTILPIDEPYEELDSEEDEEDTGSDEELVTSEEAQGAEHDGEESGRRRRRRRRRRGRGEREIHADERTEGESHEEAAQEGDEPSVEREPSEEGTRHAEGSDERNGRRRRRGRRGGRGGNGRDFFAGAPESPAEGQGEEVQLQQIGEQEAPTAGEEQAVPELSPVPAGENAPQSAGEPELPAEIGAAASTTSATEAEPISPTAPEPAPEPVAVVLTPPDPDRPKRAGWWSRAKSVLGGS
ncbi:Rne/Rng family ribonuclease [Microvirga massiliensis]|uniref:Rne/Rng family ribonuclease n=1 Tax=Microvirga massiliensis TaxID=1033741 RepID=UPI00062BE815|nr:ribonuclease E/G [Microvirga massiliensis]